MSIGILPDYCYVEPAEDVRRNFNSEQKWQLQSDCHEKDVYRQSASLFSDGTSQNSCRSIREMEAALLEGIQKGEAVLMGSDLWIPSRHKSSSQEIKKLQHQVLEKIKKKLAPQILAVVPYIEDLQRLQIPAVWADEGIAPPSAACKDRTRDVICKMQMIHDLLPEAIAASIEGGVFIAYRQPNHDRVLRVEVDNELDIVSVLSIGGGVVRSAMIERFSDLDALVAGLKYGEDGGKACN